MHCKQLQKKVIKEETGTHERLMRPRQLLENDPLHEDPRDKRKRNPSTQLISQLKGVPEKGKLPKARVENAFALRRKERMSDMVRVEVMRAITADYIPGFENDVTAGRPQIVDVEMSSDLKRARVSWLLPTMNDTEKSKKEWTKRFEQSRGMFRKVIAGRIRSRFVPDLEFKVASTADASVKELTGSEKNEGS